MENDHPATEQWSVYESNVQAYRGLAMSAQSLFLAVGAILLDETLPLIAVMVLAMTATWWVFFPVIFARTAIVDFHKFDLGRRFDRAGHVREDPAAPGLREVEYAKVTNRALRGRVYAEVTRGNRVRYGADAPAFRTLRQTRLKLDLVMPCLFTAAWATFVAYALAT